MWRFLVVAIVAASLLAVTFGSSLAQSYPIRPITMVVAWPPGSGIDVMTRVMQDALREELGQPIIVDNRPGAAGSIGAQAVARAAPDGYTLLFTAASLNMVAVMGTRLGFEVPGSFTPIVNVAVTPSLLVVHPSVRASSMQEFIALARARPSPLFYSTAGIGAPSHFVTELLRTRTGFAATVVPFPGSPQQMQALLAGDVQFGIINSSTALPQIQAGRVRALAVIGRNRIPQAPDVPTLHEQGLTGFSAASYWNGILGPAGLPQPIAERIAAAINRVLARPDISERLAPTGNELDGRSSPTAFAALMKEDMEIWAEVARAANIRAQ
ncbi:tripartite tricarboxylate transporter substrate binding protein [Belnapia sp. T18]|uniref:Tripartite tricarboxylate transporter substrate binding protein n=1 Tax=Belnapia arida TaxID=2804533 RepID=A0ABS1UAB6_9PROT|nr:tripartite tricarboxylate transporter substrate binding protein [Belnapia arida]MBL6081480.1 tripartite tricarboxylate transporter substrate binding protein [Belnapia arida]